MIPKLWLRLLIFLAFCVAFVVVTLPSVATVAYDGQCHVSLSPDKCAACGFDGAKTQPAGESHIEFAGPSAFLATFSEFLAADSGVLNGANYAQRTFSSTFSSGGTFAGQTVEDVAAALRSGTLTPADVPIQYIVQDGNTLMLNTRSAQALEQAGIPRSAWNAVDMTGDAAAQARLAAQLQRNGLTSQGIPTVVPSGH
jgi:hypothetical protein